jgi:pyruvate dehydrogenase E1 component alpha subunit
MASTSPSRVSFEDAAGINVTAEEALDWFRKMSLIRRFEERAEEAYGQGKIGGFLHLYIGEEAIAVGAMAALLPEDDVITHYRDH